MPYSRVTHTAYGAEAIAYTRGDGKGHNGAEQRNEYVMAVNMLPDAVMPFEQQMAYYWSKASSKNKNQVLRLVQSFSRKELDPDNPADGLRAAQIMYDTLQKGYPDRQAAIFVQKDGEGGYWHVHGVVCNVSMTDFKGCTDEQKSAAYLRQLTDTVCARYFDLDYGQGKDVEKQSQTERAKEGYVWKDDLKARIMAARDAARDMQDFYRQLTLHGVEGTEKTRRKSGDKYITFELTDTAGFDGGKVPENLKARSYKLGGDYEYSALEQHIQQQHQAAAPHTWQQQAPTQAQAPKTVRMEPIAAPEPMPTPSSRPVIAPEPPRKAPDSDFDGPMPRHTHKAEKPEQAVQERPERPKEHPDAIDGDEYERMRARRLAQARRLTEDIEDSDGYRQRRKGYNGPSF